MPAITLVMVLTNVGLQLFNNWRNTQTSDEMRRKQQEFQRAAQNRNHDRMLQLLREGQAMQEQWENENHKQRITNINADFDNLIKRTLHSQALQSWPLSVLPMVMKNQSLGSFRTQSDENLALHVILTPSNSDTFNTSVFSQIELGVEAFCNQYWNNLSQHPIIFYGGAWKSKSAPEQTEIDQLKADLTHLPVLMITPYFTHDTGNLAFNINMWGMGNRQTNRNNEQFDINATEMVIKPTEQEFSYYKVYAQDTNYGDELTEVTIEEFVPYLQCMIGYLADVYFWSAHKRTPLLPTLLSIGTLEICYKQRTNIIDGYANLFQSHLALLNENPTDSEGLTTLSNYLISTSNVFDNALFQKQLESLYLEACKLRGFSTKDIQNAIVYAVKNNIFLPTDTVFLKQFAVFHKVETKIMKTQKLYNMKTLDAKTYSLKRDELLGLIDQILKVDGIKEGEKNAFLATQKRLLENQFNIVLIGEFQGGKSTTFNALCGGREISPRGAMNKTSAICITATNIADPKADEYAIVNWKNDFDKLKLMDRFVGLLTAEDLDIQLNEDELFSVEKYFSFENTKHIKALKNAIAIQEQTSEIDTESQEVLRIAKIIIAFSEDNNLKLILENNKYEISDVAKFAVFPDRWEERWANIKCFEDIKKQFTVEDILFAFVGEIDCHVHSDNLARLGCSITDCPGLFASSWDTSVALNAISKSNAVIYLLGGVKVMGEGDEKAIKTIFQNKSLADKVFFAINKKQNDVITSNIVETNTSKLKNLGIQRTSIWEFNALLFFLSEYGRTLLFEKMDDFSKQMFLRIAERNGYSDALKRDIPSVWSEMVSDIGFTLKDPKLKMVDELNEKSCSVASTISKSDNLLSMLNNEIVAQKAESILISNGSEKIGETLQKIDVRLKSIEDEALKTVQQAEAEFLSAQEAFLAFETKVNEILSNAFPEYLSQQLAQNAYYNEITQPKVIDKIALKLAVEIPKQLTIKKKASAAWYKMMEAAANGKILTEKAKEQRDKAKKELTDILGPTVKNAVQTELSNSIETWQTLLNNGQHIDYKAYILPKLDEIADKINNEWEKAILQSEFLSGYSIPRIPLDSSLQAFNTSSVTHSHGVVNATAEAAIRLLVQDVITEVVSILSGIIVGLIVDFVLFGGLGHILGAIYAAMTYIYTKILGKQKESIDPSSREELGKNQKKIYDSIRPSLGDTFQNNETRSKAVDGLKKCPKNIFSHFEDYYKTQLSQQKKTLNDDIEEKRAAKQESWDKQQEVAKHARVVREQQIEPLAKKISNFIDSCY